MTLVVTGEIRKRGEGGRFARHGTTDDMVAHVAAAMQPTQYPSQPIQTGKMTIQNKIKVFTELTTPAADTVTCDLKDFGKSEKLFDQIFTASAVGLVYKMV